MKARFPASLIRAEVHTGCIQDGKKKARIAKDVTFHCLQHNFATHLLEKGINAIYIRDILGHFNIKTTEGYLHVRKEELVMITSPLDDL